MLEQGEIIRCYNAVLRRTPKPGELRFWTSPYAKARTSSDLVETLICQATEVRSMARLYLGLFQRMPELFQGKPDIEDDGFSYWIQVLRTFRDKHRGIAYKSALSYAIADWLDSPEYKAHFQDQLSAQCLIEKIFSSLAGRSPTPDEMKHWCELLQDRKNTVELAIAVAESDECKARLNPRINEALQLLAAS